MNVCTFVMFVAHWCFGSICCVWLYLPFHMWQTHCISKAIYFTLLFSPFRSVDGNYTTWTDWTDCSTSCYATGTQSRNRTCTNPTPLGIGLDCTRYGEPYEVQFCVPTHLDICDRKYFDFWLILSVDYVVMCMYFYIFVLMYNYPKPMYSKIG